MAKWPWFLALFCGTAACQQLAGDFEVRRMPDGPVTTACPVGQVRCNGEFLLSCGEEGAFWSLRDTCAADDLCDSGAGICRRCQPGALQCDGAIRQECSASGESWEERETCDSDSLCNPTYCGGCTPGERACRGAGETSGRELWECGEDAVWSVLLETCKTAPLCELGLDEARGSDERPDACAEARCDEPGAYRCSGQTLERCRRDLTGWELIDTCASVELCQLASETSLVSEGAVDACPLGCASAGAFVCDGMTLMRCREDLTGLDSVLTCEPGSECNPVQGVCSERCEPGEYQCNAESLRLCNAEQSFAVVETCASAALCRVDPDGRAGACDPPGCPQAGTFQCEGAELYLCRDDLLGWELAGTCASAELCSALDRRCNEPLCAPNELRCFGAELRRCAPSLREWEVLASCGEGEFCDNSSEDPGCKLACPAEARCNGGELERCTESGWVHQANCATNELCSCTLAGACTLGVGSDGCGVPVCGGTLPEYRCSEATLERCEAGRNGWETSATCASAALCYPGEEPLRRGGYCATCPTAGEVRCRGSGSSTELEVCAADRRSWVVTQRCSAAYGCVENGMQDYCAVCSEGAVDCNGATLARCGADRRNWVNTACASAALCDEANAQCDVCQANQNSCDGMQLRHCSSDGQQIQTQNCPRYCDAEHGECDGCLANTSRCANEVLYKCSSNGQTEASTICATAALCNAAGGVCERPACEVGQRRCSGAQPERCNTNRTGWEPTGASCATAALCVAASGTCATPTCMPGQRRCSGSQPEVCNANQNGWSNSGRACATPALCNSSGTCTEPACAAGERRCNGAQPEICNADRTGFVADGAACASAALCTAENGCTAPACAVGELRCNGAQPEICNASRTGWDANGAGCATAALCSAGSCTAPACDAGAYDCQGVTLRRCNADRTGFEDVERCANANLCNAGAGRCDMPACSAGEHRCSGAVLEVCEPDGSAWRTLSECTSAELCDAAGGECDQCRAPAFDCTDNVLKECATNGQWSNPVDCGAGLCDATLGQCVPPATP